MLAQLKLWFEAMLAHFDAQAVCPYDEPGCHGISCEKCTTDIAW